MANDEEIFIFGAGGHGKVVLDAALSSGRNVIFVVDDNVKNSTLLNLPLKKLDLIAASGKKFVVAIGDDNIRAQKYSDLAEEFTPVTIVHPSAVVSKFSEISLGVVVLSQANIGPNAVIGQNSIINTGAIVEHDCKVGVHSHIAPHATLCGAVTVGERTLVGAGAVVNPGVKIGSNVKVGSGAVVICDVPDGATVVGCPAR